MRCLAMLAATWICLAPCSLWAETRIMGVLVTRVEEKTRVSIHSAVPKENVRRVEVSTAAKLLMEAQGSGSAVIVGINARDVPLGEYLPLLEAVAANGTLQLAYIEGRAPGFIHENIRGRIKRMAAER